MKILREGRQQTGWAKEYKCTGHGNNGGGCGAMLLVEQPDLFHTYRSCIDETEVFVTFRCPECGVLTDIKDYPTSRDLPSRNEWEKKNGQFEKGWLAKQFAENAKRVAELPDWMKSTPAKELEIVLTEKEMDDLMMGRKITQQIVSAKFNNAPLIDLVIRAKVSK